jgi:hypothetical protein
MRKFVIECPPLRKPIVQLYGIALLLSLTLPFASPTQADDGIISALQKLTTPGGADTLKSEVRPLKDFDAISLRAPIDLNITIGKEFIITVLADEKLLPSITTRLNERRLVIDSKDVYSSMRMPKINVQLPALHQLSIQGSGDAKIAGLTEGALRLQVSGSGDIVAAGTVDSLEIDVDGSGDVDGSLLIANNGRVRINGSGDVHVYAQNALDILINGSGDVTYLGAPHNFSKSVNGSGDIHHE